MLRIGLFLVTNLAVLALIGAIFQALGLEQALYENGIELDLTALLFYSAAVGFTGALISLFMSKGMAKMAMRVRVIETPKGAAEEWLVGTVANLAKTAGIGMPEVGVFEGPPNAFATGWNKNASLVAVSTGLMRDMNQSEVEAVLAHEVSHVANGDMVTLALIQGVVNTFVVFLARVFAFAVSRAATRDGNASPIAYYALVFAAQMVLGVAATAIVMWFSRWREFRADAGGARLAGRDNMIAALERLGHGGPPAEVPDEVKALCISAGRMSKLFASHPPIEDRIKALRKLDVGESGGGERPEPPEASTLQKKAMRRRWREPGGGLSGPWG